MRIVALLLITFAGFVSSNELIIPVKAPVGIEALVTPVNVHTAPKRRGSHGLVEYCYKSDSYVVYSTNLLGFGYQLSEVKPENLQCVLPNIQLIAKNKIGMYIGMSKQEIEKLIGNIQIKNEQILVWQSKVMINGIKYDLQTYTELKFKNNQLAWLSVFTTETN